MQLHANGQMVMSGLIEATGTGAMNLYANNYIRVDSLVEDAAFNGAPTVGRLHANGQLIVSQFVEV